MDALLWADLPAGEAASWLLSVGLSPESPAELMAAFSDQDLSESFTVWTWENEAPSLGQRIKIKGARNFTVKGAGSTRPGGEVRAGSQVLCDSAANGTNGIHQSVLSGEGQVIHTQQPLLFQVPQSSLAKPASVAQMSGALGVAELEANFAKLYSAFVYHEDKWPCSEVIRRFAGMKTANQWDFVPWSKLVSQSQASGLRERRRQAHRAETGLLSVLGLVEEADLELEVAGGAYAIQRRLEVRAVVLAMLDCGHLSLWECYVTHFVALFSEPPPDSNSRRVSVLEAEHADAHFWRDLQRLRRSGYSWDVALTDLVSHRGTLGLYLMHRPKPAASSKQVSQSHQQLSQGPVHQQQQGRGGTKRPQEQPDHSYKSKKARGGKSFCWPFQHKRCTHGVHCKFPHVCRECFEPHAFVDCPRSSSTSERT